MRARGRRDGATGVSRGCGLRMAREAAVMNRRGGQRRPYMRAHPPPSRAEQSLRKARSKDNPCTCGNRALGEGGPPCNPGYERLYVAIEGCDAGASTPRGGEGEGAAEPQLVIRGRRIGEGRSSACLAGLTIVRRAREVADVYIDRGEMHVLHDVLGALRHSSSRSPVHRRGAAFKTKMDAC